MLAAVASLGWNGAELNRIEPNDLLAAAFVVRMSFEQRALETASPEAVALELWYPPVPAAEILDLPGPSGIDARRDARYDLRLPFFRTKP
jgi:hypothetical protein